MGTCQSTGTTCDCPINGNPTCANILNGTYPPQVACGVPGNYWSLWYACVCDGPCLDQCASTYCAGNAMSTACSNCVTGTPSPGCFDQELACMAH